MKKWQWLEVLTRGNVSDCEVRPQHGQVEGWLGGAGAVVKSSSDSTARTPATPSTRTDMHLARALPLTLDQTTTGHALAHITGRCVCPSVADEA